MKTVLQLNMENFIKKLTSIDIQNMHFNAIFMHFTEYLWGYRHHQTLPYMNQVINCKIMTESF